MTRLSELRIAQISIGILLLVIIRSLGEYFRLQYLHGDALVIGQVTPYFAGALFADAHESHFSDRLMRRVPGHSLRASCVGARVQPAPSHQ